MALQDVLNRAMMGYQAGGVAGQFMENLRAARQREEIAQGLQQAARANPEVAQRLMASGVQIPGMQPEGTVDTSTLWQDPAMSRVIQEQAPFFQKQMEQLKLTQPQQREQKQQPGLFGQALGMLKQATQAQQEVPQTMQAPRGQMDFAQPIQQGRGVNVINHGGGASMPRSRFAFEDYFKEMPGLRPLQVGTPQAGLAALPGQRQPHMTAGQAQQMQAPMAQEPQYESPWSYYAQAPEDEGWLGWGLRQGKRLGSTGLYYLGEGMEIPLVQKGLAVGAGLLSERYAPGTGQYAGAATAALSPEAGGFLKSTFGAQRTPALPRPQTVPQLQG